MITVITILYCGLVMVAFKVIRIPVRASTVATAVVIGFVLLGGIVIGWKFSAPITQQMFLKRDVLQIVPDVKEFVSKVHVATDETVQKGDVLFEINPQRFQFAVYQSTAELNAAHQTVSQLEAGIQAAEAAVQGAAAATAAAKAELDTAHELQKVNAGAIAAIKVDESEQAYASAQANDKRVQAAKKEADFALAAAKHSADVVAAQLKTAEFDLQQCEYRAPADGKVVNWQIREGLMAARLRLTSFGTFMQSDP
ncbi:MAG TPA: biotin/lipoyl-binding protein [Fuerstia sp.]|nr:biotin/lipoyl-binding protein [Fuerstiella sp.]